MFLCGFQCKYWFLGSLICVRKYGLYSYDVNYLWKPLLYYKYRTRILDNYKEGRLDVIGRVAPVAGYLGIQPSWHVK